MNFTTFRKSFQRFNNPTPAGAKVLKKFSVFFVYISHTLASFSRDSDEKGVKSLLSITRESFHRC